MDGGSGTTGGKGNAGGKAAREKFDERDPTAVERLARDRSSRRRFVEKLGSTAAVGTFAMLLAACGQDNEEGGSAIARDPGKGQATGPNDADIVNYALTLEYLERDFYNEVNNRGLVDSEYASLYRRIEANEAEHVVILRALAKQLATEPVERPRVRFPMSTPADALKLAVSFENTGAGAYLGQAAFVEDPDVLAAALSVHTVEARHAAALNMIAGKSITPDGPFAKPLTMRTVLKRVKPFIVS